MFPLQSANTASGYFLQRSLRFRASASARLVRTPAASGNQRTWTWNGAFKRGDLGRLQLLFSAYGAPDADDDSFGFDSSDRFFVYAATIHANLRLSTQVFRDPAAFYWVDVAMDTTNATAQNRLRVWVNGTEITAWTTNYSIPLNQLYYFNQNVPTTIGATHTPTLFFDGYLAEVNFIDGQALTPSSFGSTNSTTGVWQPAKYTGTYGTNGFYLPFTDNSALTTSSNVGLGKDFSGNGNYWVTNNISITSGVTYDSMTDVPTLTSATAANYCVLNPLNSNTTVTGGNLNTTPASVQCGVAGTMTIDFNSYFEFDGFIGSGTGVHVGIIQASPTNAQLSTTANSDSVIYRKDGAIFRNTGSGFTQVQTVASYGATSDVISIAVSKTGNTIQFYKNNVAVGTAISLTNTVSYMPWITYGGTGGGVSANFGQRPFAYTPPTGFVALNTYNLPDSTIKQGNKVMDATLYTGNLVGQVITNAAGFKPDLVWPKSRSAATDNKLVDSVRGATLALVSNSTAAETTDLTGVVSFNSNGFTLGTSTTYNNLAATYVAWQWQAGQGSTSTNTNGTITSTVSVNASAGFSIVTYTGTGANATVGHGLGIAPAMIITKDRTVSSQWFCWHQNLTSAAYGLLLSATNAQINDTGFMNSTLPTSSVFSLGNSSITNFASTPTVAYCWSEIAGFSKFGSYVGNGSADGTFVYLGFRARYIMIKRTDTTSDWTIFDTARNPYNTNGARLWANLSSAEGSGDSAYSIFSNGFKLGDADGSRNASGGTYVYMAFAENPFKVSLAR